MAKKAYGGVSNLSRNGIKLYGGVVNTSRKIIKGYVGVSNLSRQFWPPGITEKYVIFKDGVFIHVPTGFDFSGNVEEVIYPSSVRPFISTNKMIWEHQMEYTRPWSVNGININSNFIYNYDIPAQNRIYIPSWKQTYAIENRAKIPSGVNNYYLRITGYGYFSVALWQLTTSSYDDIYFVPAIHEGVRVYDYEIVFDTDDVVTVDIQIKSSASTRYVDRVVVREGIRTGTYNNAWLESKSIKRYNATTRIWSQPIPYFSFGYRKFEIYYSGGYPERVIAEATLSDAQVYSISWRHATDSSYPMYNGAELLSKAAFTVHCVAYNYNGDINTEVTQSAEQIIFNGIPFYRYRYDIGKWWDNIDNWYPGTVGDNFTGGMFSEDGRLEYEFFESLHEDLSSIQIQEISIITL